MWLTQMLTWHVLYPRITHSPAHHLTFWLQPAQCDVMCGGQCRVQCLRPSSWHRIMECGAECLNWASLWCPSAASSEDRANFIEPVLWEIIARASWSIVWPARDMKCVLESVLKWCYCEIEMWNSCITQLLPIRHWSIDIVFQNIEWRGKKRI